VSQLKQLLETNPSEKTPELQFLTDRDWVWLVNKKTKLETEDGSLPEMDPKIRTVI